MAKTLPKTYTLDMLRDEVQALVNEGVVDCQQPIYALCRYICDREWECVELTLDENDYQLRDRIIDLLPQGRWEED